MWPFSRKEKRSLENPSVSLASPEAFEILFGSTGTAAGEAVSAKSALSVPAVWAAVNFLSSTIASLPLNLYQRTADGRQRSETDPLHRLLHDRPNAEWTSYRWRKYAMQCVLVNGGRAYTLIQRNTAGSIINLWPLAPSLVAPTHTAEGTVYTYTAPGMAPQVYSARDVLDIPFMLEADQISHVDPVTRLRRTIGLTIALESYAARHFENGGVPPLSLEGPLNSPAAATRAGEDIYGALKKARREGRNILPLPIGHVLKPVGFNPEQSQLESARRFQVEEVARVYNLPPTFLQDLTHASYSNSEQQDLHFVKHTLGQWLKAWEQEMNLKLFSETNTTNYVEFNVDGLLRGDFATRMSGLAQAVQNALLAPNEARAMENRPPKEGGDELLLQQNMIGLGRLGQVTTNQGAANDA